MKDANYKRTFIIKIHGATSEANIAELVSRELYYKLSELAETCKGLHFSFAEDDGDLAPDTLQ